MNVTVNGPLYCECGYAMLCYGVPGSNQQSIGCSNPQCKNYEKRFKPPTLTLLEFLEVNADCS